MMLLPSGEPCGHQVIGATACTKKVLGHLLVAWQKGPVGAIAVIALVPKADRSAAHVPFTLLSVAMLAGLQPWVRQSPEKAHPWI